MKRISLILACLIAISCNAQTKKNATDKKVSAEQKERLIRMNKQLLNNESVQIDNYIQEHHLTMKRSGSGLRYLISVGKGSPVKHKDAEKVSVAYTLTDLKGNVFYVVKTSDPLVFNPGRSELIRGIQEATLYMNPGDEASLIIPSHLGYGKNGDGKKVPPSSVLLCKLQVLKIEQ